MLQRLRGSADESELSEFLRHEVEEHFGLDSAREVRRAGDGETGAGSRANAGDPPW
ncbi:hypothetical protein ACIBG6_05130 [Streptomyces sp. NPDC050842]|uniref:hypothetical protein n=1 Tax=Streptomyces sp. NPDC050842 TaxID=3365636 RepID=UPI0037BC54EA